MKKKLLLIGGVLFVAVILQLMFGTNVNAKTTYNSEISYEENYDGTIKVMAAGEYIESATIPSTINGKPVTEVADSGFRNCKYLKTVTLPSSITEIGSNAFDGCSSLVSINIPSKVTEIPYWGFQHCTSLKSINLSNITTINPDAFYDCTSLSSVTLSSKLKTIDSGAFKGCSSLKSITLPSSLKELGAESFMETGLTSITLPSSITEMGTNYGAFEGCKSLKTATINVSVKELPDNLFKDCTALTTVKFASNSPITKFRRATFYGCTSLTSVTLPTKLTNIGKECFKDCKSLKNITIPDSVQSLEMWAFDGCTGITTISLPYNVKTVDAYAFADCSALRNIYFTKAIQEIDDWAFYGNTSKSIRFYGYSGTAAKYFAQENGYSFTELTPVSSINISGANSVLKGKTITLKATVSPSSAYNKNVVWSSSNNSVATVSQAGVVTGVKSGTATITAMAKDGTGVKKTYNVTVKLTDLPFRDVIVSDWYYSSVKYTYQNGIISGATSTEFRPNAKITRGMIVTILWRMEGSPKVTGVKDFTDVKGQYYYDAVRWAAKYGVVNGYGDGRFGPNANITREQLATILCNYAKYKKKYTSATVNTSKYKDWNRVSSYARASMQWAIAKGVVTGKDNGTRVDPLGTASRGEAAVMIYNYCTKIKN